jgi:hypothetical protein
MFFLVKLEVLNMELPVLMFLNSLTLHQPGNMTFSNEDIVSILRTQYERHSSTKKNTNQVPLLAVVAS